MTQSRLFILPKFNPGEIFPCGQIVAGWQARTGWGGADSDQHSLNPLALVLSWGQGVGSSLVFREGTQAWTGLMGSGCKTPPSFAEENRSAVPRTDLPPSALEPWIRIAASSWRRHDVIPSFLWAVKHTSKVCWNSFFKTQAIHTLVYLTGVWNSISVWGCRLVICYYKLNTSSYLDKISYTKVDGGSSRKGWGKREGKQGSGTTGKEK